MIPTRLSPAHLDPLIESLQRSGRLLAVEEGTGVLGLGCGGAGPRCRNFRTKIETGRADYRSGTVIPVAADLEEACLPQVSDIISQAREMVEA